MVAASWHHRLQSAHQLLHIVLRRTGEHLYTELADRNLRDDMGALLAHALLYDFQWKEGHLCLAFLGAFRLLLSPSDEITRADAAGLTEGVGALFGLQPLGHEGRLLGF